MTDRDAARPIRVLWLTKGLGPGGAEHLMLAAATVRDRDAFHYEVDYLLPWKDALVGLIKSYADGRTDDEAFQAATGLSMSAFSFPKSLPALPSGSHRLDLSVADGGNQGTGAMTRDCTWPLATSSRRRV